MRALLLLVLALVLGIFIGEADPPLSYWLAALPFFLGIYASRLDRLIDKAIKG